MKNQKTTRSMRYDQASDDLTNYRTDDPAANYETEQDDKVKQRKEPDSKLPDRL